MSADDLLAAWLDARQRAATDAALADLLAADPAQARRLQDLLRLDDRIARLLVPERGDFVNRVRARIAAGDGARLVQRARDSVRRLRRRRRRRLVLALALPVAALLAIALLPAPTPADGAPRHEGRVVAAGAVIEADGRAQTLSYADGTAVELAAGTALRVDTDDGRRLTLARGSLAATVAPQRAAAPFVVTTARSEVTVIGTQLAVATTAGSDEVAVRSGAIRLRRQGEDAAITVAAGEEAVVSDHGPLRAMVSLPVALQEDFADPVWSRGHRGWWLGEPGTGPDGRRCLVGAIATGTEGSPYRGVRLTRGEALLRLAGHRLSFDVWVGAGAKRLVVQCRDLDRGHFVHRILPLRTGVWDRQRCDLADLVHTVDPDLGGPRAGDRLQELLIYTEAADGGTPPALSIADLRIDGPPLEPVPEHP